MNNSVVIKGNKYGISVIMDKDMPFEELLGEVAEKFKSSANFFGKSSLAISFEGRTLSSEEEKKLLDIISENSEINIVCVMDNDEMREKCCKKAVEDKLEELSIHTGQFYKGTLRSGQMLEAESSLVIPEPELRQRATL